MDPDGVEEHAVRILATLDGASATTLRAFRDGLEGSGLPSSIFGGMIATLLTDRVHGIPADRLTVMRMSSTLRQGLACGGGRFADRLEDAESPFWVARPGGARRLPRRRGPTFTALAVEAVYPYSWNGGGGQPLPIVSVTPWKK